MKVPAAVNTAGRRQAGAVHLLVNALLFLVQTYTCQVVATCEVTHIWFFSLEPEPEDVFIYEAFSVEYWLRQHRVGPCCFTVTFVS